MRTSSSIQSGSIGDTNIGNLKTGLGNFVDTLGSSSAYSASRFSGDATKLTTGYVDAATFKTNISGINSNGRTWTRGGIVTGEGNASPGGSASRPDVMFIVTDGNPNVSVGGTENSLSDPLTWLDAANAAIDEANTARANFWVRAVLLGTGDSNLPFGGNNAAWQAAVMTALGGGSYIQQVDWTQTAQGLLASTGCQPTIAKSHSVPVGNGTGSNVDAGKAFTWTITVTVPSELGQTTTISDTLPSGFSYTAIADTAAGGGDDTKMSCTPAAGTAFSCTLLQHAPAGTYTISVTTTAPAANLQANCKQYTNTATSKYGSLDLSPATDTITSPAQRRGRYRDEDAQRLRRHPGPESGRNVYVDAGGLEFRRPGSIHDGPGDSHRHPARRRRVCLNTSSPSVSGGSPAGTGGGACSYNSGTRVLTCNAGASGATFGNGSTLTVALTATPTTAGDLFNSASTCKVDPSAVIPETNEDNNTCTSTVHVHDASPITVVKAAGALTGNSASWTITIDNTGTYAIDHSVVITDAGATFSGNAQVTGGHGSTCSPTPSRPPAPSRRATRWS